MTEPTERDREIYDQAMALALIKYDAVSGPGAKLHDYVPLRKFEREECAATVTEAREEGRQEISNKAVVLLGELVAASDAYENEGSEQNEHRCHDVLNLAREFVKSQDDRRLSSVWETAAADAFQRDERG
jgi:hypothetical protein